MNNITYTREQAINYLIERDITDIDQMLVNNDYGFLDDILRNGFIGYSKLDNKNLIKEIQNSTDDETIINVK